MKVRLRKDKAPIAGLFSHIGDLNQVHHIWGMQNKNAKVPALILGCFYIQ